MESSEIKLIDCPRDAMQGWKDFILTQQKVEYINALLQVGFNIIDFGNFGQGWCCLPTPFRYNTSCPKN